MVAFRFIRFECYVFLVCGNLPCSCKWHVATIGQRGNYRQRPLSITGYVYVANQVGTTFTCHILSPGSWFLAVHQVYLAVQHANHLPASRYSGPDLLTVLPVVPLALCQSTHPRNWHQFTGIRTAGVRIVLAIVFFFFWNLLIRTPQPTITTKPR